MPIIVHTHAYVTTMGFVCHAEHSSHNLCQQMSIHSWSRLFELNIPLFSSEC